MWDFCRDAVQTNVVGTRHAIQLARSLKKLEVGHVLLLRVGLHVYIACKGILQEILKSKLESNPWLK